jgi:pimeloyl-ACP methyl ester carboxylesterase
VLEDRSKPAGRRLDLRLMVLPAQGAFVEPEPLVYLDGGPGASSVDHASYASWALEGLRATHDLILIDMRGTGESNPLRCDLYADAGRLARYLAPVFPLDRVRECATRLERRADLTQYTTEAAAADLDEVRTALGVEQLNIFGASYGTRLALEYIREHPEHVRRVALLSPIPASQALVAAISRSADAALGKATLACAAIDECRTLAPSPRGDVETLLARLGREPVTVRLWNWRRLSYESVALTRRAVAELLWFESYDPEALLRALPRVHQAVAGDYVPLARQLARGSQLRRSGRSEGLMLSVLCTEDAPRLRDALGAADSGRLLGVPVVPELLDACRVWPRGKVSARFASPVESNVPTLLIAGGKDPITPPDLADSTARTLPNSERYVDPMKGHASLDDQSRTRIAQFIQCELRCIQ